MRKKIPTGIPGFDELIGGGFPEGSTTVVSGPPGIGKSSLAMQYIYNGVKDFNDPGLYLTIEDTVDDIEEYAAGFGWTLRQYEEDGKIRILGREIFERTDVDLGIDFGIMRDIMNDIGARRVVLDSITLFSYLFKDETSRRLHLLRFLELMKRDRCTVFMTAELPENFLRMRFEQEHFLADGLIILFWSRYKANTERCLWVVKIRGSKINSDIRPFKITSEGVVVYPREVPFTLLKKEGSGSEL
jgi:KaiC/GvpD/RAD55 family RecA-like ATPase